MQAQQDGRSAPCIVVRLSCKLHPAVCYDPCTCQWAYELCLACLASIHNNALRTSSRLDVTHQTTTWIMQHIWESQCGAHNRRIWMRYSNILCGQRYAPLSNALLHMSIEWAHERLQSD